MSLLDYIIAPIPLRQTFLVASRITINGSFTCDGSAVIIGRINGDVSVDGDLTLAKKGKIIGNIKAANITVKGMITGNIYCEGKMIVGANACIKGNIITGEIDVAKNALIEGSITKLTPQNVVEERNYFIETSMQAKPMAVLTEEIIVEKEPEPVIEEKPKEKQPQTWF